MTVTITCESLKELQELAQQLVILPAETKQAATPKEKTRTKETKAKEEKEEAKQPKISADDVRKLHENGMKPEQIAKELGCSKATVYNKLKE